MERSRGQLSENAPLTDDKVEQLPPEDDRRINDSLSVTAYSSLA